MDENEIYTVKLFNSCTSRTVVFYQLVVWLPGRAWLYDGVDSAAGDLLNYFLTLYV